MDASEFPDYSDYVVNPVDIDQIEKVSCACADACACLGIGCDTGGRGSCCGGRGRKLEAKRGGRGEMEAFVCSFGAGVGRDVCSGFVDVLKTGRDTAG